MTTAQTADLTEHVLSVVGEIRDGVILYGSRARGTSRTDSDFDVLQLVERAPRSYSVGPFNVTAYTPAHLTDMARRGSLFVRHLIDEGIVISDPRGLVAAVLASYKEPNSYTRLKIELRLILEAVAKPDAIQYRPLLDDLARFTVRSGLYIRTAELGEPLFDIDYASEALGVPRIAKLIREPIVEDLNRLIDIGLELLDAPLPGGVPNTLHGIAIWSMNRYPLAFSQLEQAIARNARLDYSLLTLPPS